jgi:hypothetical protein
MIPRGHLSSKNANDKTNGNGNNIQEDDIF